MAKATVAVTSQPGVERNADYKVALLKQRFPDLNTTGLAPSIHRVDIRSPQLTRIVTRDGGWIEVDEHRRTLRQWGRPGGADRLAAAIRALPGFDDYECLDRAGTFASPNSDGRSTRALLRADVSSIAARWRSWGYNDVVESPDGVWVVIGRTRLRDLGHIVEVYGPVTDEAIQAIVNKAKVDWNGGLRLVGHWTSEQRDRLWLECQRQGVVLEDVQPSKTAKASWEAELADSANVTRDLATIRKRAREAKLLLEAAQGDAASLEQLDLPLQAFVTSHLDDDQRRDFARSSITDVTAELHQLRAFGRAEIERLKLQGVRGEAPSLITAPKPHDTKSETLPARYGD